MKRIFLILFVLGSLSGCISSLYPFYKSDQLVLDENLAGKWLLVDNPNTVWTFEEDSEKSYDLILKNDDGTEKFHGHLFKLGKEFFLDIYPDDELFTGSTLSMATLYPCHTILWMEITEDSIDVRMVDGQWLMGKLKEDPELIKHEMGKDNFVLTADTEELQKLIRKMVKEEDAFGNPTILKKI